MNPEFIIIIFALYIKILALYNESRIHYIYTCTIHKNIVIHDSITIYINRILITTINGCCSINQTI